MTKDTKDPDKSDNKGRDIAEDLEADADKIPSRLRFDAKGKRIKDDDKPAK